ncbi:MAG: exonuclease SbcCD subunit D [Lachnospirales bacterium]
MNFLHTSDWHLGKYLVTHSRLEEQEMFLKELLEICNTREIDVILLAGDIYDTFNPPAAAEELFYKYIEELSRNRLIIIVSGNHDNPQRLMAASPVIYKDGVIIVGLPNTIIPAKTKKDFSVLESGQGYFRIKFKNEIINFVTMAYPNEKRLEELFQEDEEVQLQEKFSDTVKEKVEKSCEEIFTSDINIFMGHFFVTGGKESKSERQIQVGGSLAIDVDALPKGADYIALGHLHRCQKINYSVPVYFSGSPIQYSLSEKNYSKSVLFFTSENFEPEKIYLKNYKPIELWEVENLQVAMEMAAKKAEENSYVYIKINDNIILTASEIRHLRGLKKDIIEIYTHDVKSEIVEEPLEEISLIDEFKKYYKEKVGVEVEEEVLELFLSFSEELQ